MSEFGSCIDIFKFDIFVQVSSGPWNQGLSQAKGSLLGTNAASLYHDVVISDNTVVWETTHGGNIFLGQIRLGGGVIFSTVSFSLTHSVDSFIGFSSMMISALTSPWDGILDLRWMPTSDTTDLSQTSMSLSGQFSNTISLGDTGKTFTLSNSDDINNLLGTENLVDLQILLEHTLDEVDLISSASTVNLDFHNVSLLGSEVAHQMDLGVADSSYGVAEFKDSLLGVILLILLGSVFGESLLLGVVPVFIESSLQLAGQGGGPDGGQSSQTFNGLDVSNKTDDLHWWGLDNSNSLDNFLFVQSGVNSVNISSNVGHTSLESGEGSEVWGLASVVLGERPDLSSMLPGSLSRQES